MSSVSADAPRRYHDLFDPRIPGFGFVFPLVLCAGMFVSSHVFLLFDYLVKQGSMAKETFPSFQIEQAVVSMTSAFLLLWLSRQLKNAWLIGLVYGACDNVIGITVSLISGLFKSSAISLRDWIPYTNLEGVATNLVWAVVLIGFLDIAIRLAGVRLLPILAAGIVGWLVFGLFTKLAYGQALWDWYDLARWATNGLISGLAMYIALRGQLALREGHAPPPKVEGLERVSKALFFTAIVTGTMAGYPVLAGAARDSSMVAQVLALAMLVFSGIVSLVLVHRMWSAIQDGAARTSPGRAVGLLFVPFYNIYWLFHVYKGFAEDFNAYRERHSLQAARLPAWLFLTFCILSLFGWIPAVGFPIVVATLFVEVFMIAKICDAVNAVPA